MKISTLYTSPLKHIFWKEEKEENLEEDTFSWEENMIVLYPNIRYQKIIGFGGAFTESSGYVLSLLSQNQREDALHSYFSAQTLNYTLCRTSIGSCDFSLDNYDYMKSPDLQTFSINRDEKYIIPMIKGAQKIQKQLKLLASPWSPPAFMKSNQNKNMGGKLLEEYKQLWAEYLVRYVKAYQEEGIHITYMTIQNEPKAVQTWDSCIYTSSEEASLLTNYLSPTFQQAQIPMQFLIWDHNKERIFFRTKEVFQNTLTREVTSGIAFHWYSGDHFENVRLTKEQFPEMLLLATEGCTGYSHFAKKEEIPNAEIYAHDYIGNLNAGCNGQIDWNLFLDYEGGPNHKDNYCNSPMMLSKDKETIIKNLSYYYIGHITKYIKPGAIRIAHSKYTDKIEITTFQNLDNSIIIVLLNRTDEERKYVIRCEGKLYFHSLTPHSIITHIIRK